MSPGTNRPEWGDLLAATLPVRTIVAESVGALGDAVASLLEARGLPPFPLRSAPQRIAASFMGDRMLRLDQEPVQAFAELSGFFPVADGIVRTHANYPHHRRALLDAVGLDRGCGATEFSTRVLGIQAEELEELCAESGALAVKARSEDEWAAHPAGQAARGGPVVRHTRRAPDTGSGRRRTIFDGSSVDRPLEGVRVVDMTRVIAGPVATRALALLGADVLRIDSPDLPEIDWQHLENGQGKRTARVDLTTEDGLARVHHLLQSADVLVTGYRPGSLDRFGLGAAAARTGVVHGRVSAWGTEGSWSNRRGFDSLVQAASGISTVEGRPGEPGRLPAQALDHASGYLLAAGIVRALTDRIEGQQFGAEIDVSLARTAAWLTELPGRNEKHAVAPLPDAANTVTHGRVTAARPVFAEYADYSFPAHEWGTDAPSWGDGPAA